MTRRRWIADSWDDGTAVLAGDHAAHLSRVLRARPGQEFEIAVGDRVRLGRIESISEGRVVFRLDDPVEAAPNLPVAVALSVFKFDRFEWAIEKLTELGVGEIFPVIASRTDSHLAGAAAKRAGRWRRMAVEASEQSRRIGPPVIHDPVPLKSLQVSADCHKILLAETERVMSLAKALGPPATRSLILAVGPEGGWTEAELQFFQRQGWQAVTLGKTILRAETAAIAAVAVVASGISFAPASFGS